MKPLFIALALAGLVASGSASAGYALASPPPGVTQSAAGWTFGSSAANAGSFAGGQVTTSVKVNVGGQAVTMPAKFRLAANAGQFVATALRLNPTRLFVGAVAGWIIAAGINYVNGQWQVQTNGYPNASQGYWAWPGGSNGLCYRSELGSDGPLCSAKAMQPAYNWGNCVANLAASGTTANGNCQAPGNMWWYGTANRVTACTAPQVWVNGGCIDPMVNGDAQQSDWDRAAASPLSDDAAQQVAQTDPVPVTQPQIDPLQAPVPLGPPRVDPVTGKTVQPQAVLTPSPTADDPLRVDVKVINQEVDPVTGQPATDPTTGDPKKPDDEKDPCKEQPDRLGCVDLGEPEDLDLEKKDIGQPITPVSVGGGGSCPADRSVSTSGGTIVWTYKPICDMAEMSRPIVLALAWLLAGYILIGAVRHEG